MNIKIAATENIEELTDLYNVSVTGSNRDRKNAYLEPVRKPDRHILLRAETKILLLLMSSRMPQHPFDLPQKITAFNSESPKRRFTLFVRYTQIDKKGDISDSIRRYPFDLFLY